MKTLLKGTLILTFAGVFTRILGFLYKIYLADALGAKSLGIYQLIFPIYGFCFTIYGAGIQTAVSQLVGSVHSENNLIFKQKSFSILKQAIFLSLFLSCSLSGLLYVFSDYISAHFFAVSTAGEALRILAFLFPFCGVSACIHGYTFGKKQTSIPAIAQIIEQIGKISFVFLLSVYLSKHNLKLNCAYAVAGLVVGEILAFIFNWIAFIKLHILESQTHTASFFINTKDSHYFKPLLRLAIPLTATKSITALLSSIESMLIPFMLRIYGYSLEDSLQIYGILTGMSLAFILFPSTITNSLAVLLLPTIADANTSGHTAKIRTAVLNSIKYSLLIGLLSTSLFILFGNAFGNIFFHNTTAGEFMVILSWICPFIYLATTLGSIINGLGKTTCTFLHTLFSLAVRISCVLFLIPKIGISGYLFGLLASQFILSFSHYFTLKKCLKTSFDSTKWIALPALFLIISGSLLMGMYHLFKPLQMLPSFLCILILCLIHCIFYIFLLLFFKIINLKDFRSK